MAVLYIKEQGSIVQKRGERVVVTKANMTLLGIPVVNVENIAIIGNVQLTTQALHMLLEFLRFAQYELYNHLDQRLRLILKFQVNFSLIRQEQIATSLDSQLSYHWDFIHKIFSANIQRMC
jgi:hypothetical protein